jgi:ATP-dependent helicase HrpB
MRSALPIDEVIPGLRDVLRADPCAVLRAPPGAGKTTRVPLALLEEPWLDGRIIMLEPRRLAARAAAAYMARLLGEVVGETVGYRVRMDSRVGSRTRIEVVTEGVLTRMLQDDPSLDGVSLLIFDEFHERSLHADLGLALALQAQSMLRPEMRILVMSATLDIGAVSALLGDARVVASEGRAHPVETVYLPTRVSGAVEPAIAGAVLRALDLHDGDILVFLPGSAEIRRTAERLTALPPRTMVHSLYGDLPQQEQDRAIAPSAPGTRKVVLATSIAETSLTIEGVRVVVDSGLMRVPRFSPRSGMTRLVTVPVSRAAADQRRGRAGRLGPGICYRMWTEGEQSALLAHRPPEILEADLAPLALELAAWGVVPAELRWIDPPPAAAYSQARELLMELDALDADHRITAHGHALSRLALHPRLAHMLVRARSLDAASLACDLAALLSERDILRAHDGVTEPDVRLRIPLLHGSTHAPPGHYVDNGALHRVRAEARHWRERTRVDHSAKTDDDGAGLLLAFAYPDRIAQQRGARGRFVLRNGRGAAMDARHILAGEEWIVVADVGGQGTDSRIFLAAPLSRTDIDRHFATQFVTDTDITWDAATGRVTAIEHTMLGALLMDSRVVTNVSEDMLHRTALEGIRRNGLVVLEWSRDATTLRQRLAFLHALDPEWPDVSEGALLDTLDAWLGPWIESSRGKLRDIDPAEALLGLVGWERRSRIDALAPTHIEVPSGSRIPIDYSDPASPVLAVRLQEMFGLPATPRIGAGRVPLTLHLLSPANRPVQVTRDLESFWAAGYFEVRRDLRGRYPRHYWPDNPLEAQATRRAKPRGQ